MLDWVGIDQQMQMRETSRGVDKKLHDNNVRKEQELIEKNFKDGNMQQNNLEQT